MSYSKCFLSKQASNRSENMGLLNLYLLLSLQESRDSASRRRKDIEKREERKGTGILILVYISYWDSITSEFKMHLREVSHK